MDSYAYFLRPTWVVSADNLLESNEDICDVPFAGKTISIVHDQEDPCQLNVFIDGVRIRGVRSGKALIDTLFQQVEINNINEQQYDDDIEHMLRSFS